MSTSGLLWIILVGFVAGMIARWLAPGPNKPAGFALTAVLGIAGAFLATFIGQSIGWYRADQGAGFIAATVGAFAVLFIWNRLVANNVIGDPGVPRDDPRMNPRDDPRMDDPRMDDPRYDPRSKDPRLADARYDPRSDDPRSDARYDPPRGPDGKR